MIKNILFYRCNDCNEEATVRNLEILGYHCTELIYTFTDYHEDSEFARKVLECIRKEEIHMVLSWDYFPLLASVCEMCRLPYAAWIYDCPLYTLLSKTVLYEHNYFFCFDRVQAMQLAGLGCRNVYHYPLGVDAELFAGAISDGEDVKERYTKDIAFVGSLYIQKEKWLAAKGLSDYVKGYLGGLAEAQSKVYGCNLIKEMLSEKMAEEVLKKSGIVLGEMYFWNPVQMVADFVNKEVTRKERLNAIESIAKDRRIHIYTHSAYEGSENICLCGPVSYQKEMPLVFHHSRININITSKAIESGIPLRLLDILACGGFCLTNYQPEIAEYFEDGEELVMYTGTEDMVEKAEYYLQHEEERTAIARAGQKKVREAFPLREKLAGLVRIVEEEMLPLA